MKTKEWCDQNSAKFKELFDLAGISYDDFIRTTEKRHFERVSDVWKKLEESGYIYKGKYAGWLMNWLRFNVLGIANQMNPF